MKLLKQSNSRLVVTTLIFAATALLSGCGSLSSIIPGLGGNEATNEANSYGNRKPQEIICEYNKDALDLPIKLDTYQAVKNAGLNDDPRFSISVQNDKRAILKLNLKHECACGSPERRKQLSCNDIEKAGQQLNESDEAGTTTNSRAKTKGPFSRN